MEEDLKTEPIAPVIDPAEKEAVTEDIKPQAEAEEKELPDWAKEKMSRLEEERENYKQGMLKYKKHTLEPDEATEETEETKEEEYPDWDETSKKFQRQTLDEAQKIAREATQKELSKRYEKDAIDKFIETHPEAEGKWDDIVVNYNPKSGKDSVNSILKDLNKAYIITRYEDGELEKINQKEANSQLANMSSVSKTTSKVADKGKPALSQGALKLADKMRVDPNKLAEEDDSSTATAKF